MFALQDEIAENIVDVLTVKLLPEELKGIISRSTAIMDAYHYYLMGRGFYLRGIDKHSLRIAKQMFVKATEIDADYALAYAALAICESYLSMDLSKNDPDSEFRKLPVAMVYAPRNSIRTWRKPTPPKAWRSMPPAATTMRPPSSSRRSGSVPHLFEAHFFYARNCHLQGQPQLKPPTSSSGLRHSGRTTFRSLGLLLGGMPGPGASTRTSWSAARRCLERLEPEIEAHPGQRRRARLRQRRAGRSESTRPGTGLGRPGGHNRPR